LLAEGECPPPTIAMIPVDCIENPLIAIEDPGSYYPHRIVGLVDLLLKWHRKKKLPENFQNNI